MIFSKFDQEKSQLSRDQIALLHRMVDRVQRSLELTEILSTAAAEIRAFLAVDRVKVYRFDVDASGEVVAESILDDRLPTLLGLRFPADDIPPYARELFVKAKMRTIVNVAEQTILFSPLEAMPSTRTLTVEEVQQQPLVDLLQRPVDPCHVEYLTAMGVQASLVVPILRQERLWGLFVVHHSQPRLMTETELQVVQLIADHIAVAIAQAELHIQAQEKARRELLVNQVNSLLHAEVALNFQAILEEIVSIFNGSGGRLCLFVNDPAQPTQLYTCGQSVTRLDRSENSPIEVQPIWQSSLKASPNAAPGCNLWTFTDLYGEAPVLLQNFNFQSTLVRGLMVWSLRYRQQFLGYLSIFRDEVEREIQWAGEFDPDQRQLRPRQSFKEWRELKKGQLNPWSHTEIELAQTLRHHCSMAIQQYQLFQRVQILNANLEQQVQERTAQLEKTLSQAIAQSQQLSQFAERRKSLSMVVSAIRASLDLNTIFQTTATEVRHLLNADRVGVFQFYPESNFDDGEFIAEDVLPDYDSVLAVKIHDHCFGEQYAAHYQSGRIQAVNNIHSAGLSPCHIEVLAQFQIKANLVVPLLKGKDLWGLLCIHQCDMHRDWEPADIEFATQIAIQLGVAIQQAELLYQTQQQARQLSHTLRDLQQTQTSLIQNEKMSGLGQLVAGVAHEINNPVNFIYGNLNHATEYTHDLLALLKLYQQHYPNPTPAICDKIQEIDLDFLITDLPSMLGSMKVGADRIRQIVLSLRNFSRLDHAAMKQVDIHEGIDSTLMILQHRLKARGDFPGIEVVKNYGKLPLVECFAGQLNQVFMNVLCNAIDALEEKTKKAIAAQKQHLTKPVPAPSCEVQAPTIHILTEAPKPGLIKIRFRDNGPGISETVQAKIFDPFFTTKAIGHGTGLGLSISYQIVVDKHHGIFRCISQPGKGTEFLIELPTMLRVR
ncbi:MAG: GAF domain-containing protein [Scytolyngbya sp. HA4215-MV1]|jgi:light-regulated signal transduction histidine kinase (bacteriophytochrome)|nr:GAF domain-containing protein [Scytolyngbya sp. HA4215-MV1]